MAVDMPHGAERMMSCIENRGELGVIRRVVPFDPRANLRRRKLARIKRNAARHDTPYETDSLTRLARQDHRVIPLVEYTARTLSRVFDTEA